MMPRRMLPPTLILVVLCGALGGCSSGGTIRAVHLHGRGVRAATNVIPAGPSAESASLIPAGNEAGEFVGYVRRADVMMPAKQFMRTVNARTMWPVVDADGAIVGYVAPDVPFVPLATVRAPGFDIEK